MKKMYKLFALLLAVAMLASVMTACGDKKDTAGSDITPAATADGNGDTGVAGSEQTWGNLTVFVPDTMDFKGGNGTFDPDDRNTVWLYGKEKVTDYIKITILDSEDDAKSNIETTYSMNEEYSPIECKLALSNGDWTGIDYSASGTDCVILYSVVVGKVYFTMSAGFPANSDVLNAVLESLK